MSEPFHLPAALRNGPKATDPDPALQAGTPPAAAPGQPPAQSGEAPAVSDAEAADAAERVRDALIGEGTSQTRDQRAARVRVLMRLLAQLTKQRSTARAPDHQGYARFLGAFLEACPVTSAALATAPPLTTEDADLLGPLWEKALSTYLVTVLKQWPGLAEALGTGADAHRARILAGLRRCFVTVRADRAGQVRLRALTAADLHDGRPLIRLRRGVSCVLYPENTGPPFRLCRDILHEFPPKPLTPAMTSEIETLGYTPDLTFVPKTERDDILAALHLIVNLAGRDPGTKISLTGTVWALTIPAGTGRVRYEFHTDTGKRVRPERLGAPEPRPVPPSLTGTAQNAAAAIKTDYGFRSVEGRPGGAGRRPCDWTAAELHALVPVLDRLPPKSREALSAVALVRDNTTGMTDHDMVNGAAFHNGVGEIDEDGPPAGPAPHLHVFDAIFDSRDLRFCGPPGDTGGEHEFTFAHEIGHAVATRPAARAFATADDQWKDSVTAIALYAETVRAHSRTLGIGASRPLSGCLDAWSVAHNAHARTHNRYRAAVSAYGSALASCDPVAIHTAKTAHEQAKTEWTGTASTYLDAARTLDQALPEGTLRQAETIIRGLLKAAALFSEYLRLSARVRNFAAYARDHRFPPITSYAATSPKEFFAETYALFVTDPERLWDLNWSIYRWFEDDFPDTSGYAPQPLPR